MIVTATMNDASVQPENQLDVLVVGAGVVGLAHAAAARARGLSVAVVDRDERCVGASIQNFGHVSITAQADRALALGRAGRDLWISLARRAGFWLSESGTVVVARAEDEAAVLEELAAERGSEEVQLIDRTRLAELVPTHDPSVVRAAFLPRDLRVDPRTAIPALAAWLAEQGVTFHWSTTVGDVADGVAQTSRGTITADHVIICVGHDLDRVAPDVADELDLQRCSLQMLEVESPSPEVLRPALLSGLSMLRYPAMQACPSAVSVRDRVRGEDPLLLDHELNLMLTQRPGGTLVLGDSHHYDRTPEPFDAEDVSELLLREGSRLLGVESLRVLHRWRGTYASSPKTGLVVRSMDPRSHLVSVTSGIGMTVAPAVGDEVVAGLV